MHDGHRYKTMRYIRDCHSYISQATALEGHNLARSAAAEGAASVAQWAATGQTSPQNHFRDLLRHNRRTAKINWQLYPVETVVPGVDGFGASVETRHILLPHEIASWTYQYNPREFKQVFGVRHSEEFWQRVLPTHPHLEEHPYKHVIDQEPGQTIPCRFFADDGQLGKHRSILVMHWSPILCHMDRRQSTLDSRYPMIVQDDKYAIPQITEKPLIEALVWSWHVMASGYWPTNDQHGQPLTGWREKLAGQPLCRGYKFVIMQMCNDWGYSVKAFGWSDFGKPISEEICWWCRACKSQGERCFTNFSADAPCYQHRRDNDEYMQSPAALASPLTALPGFSLWIVMPELMHAGPLGISLHSCGSVIFELAAGGFWGHHPDVDTTPIWKSRLNLQLATAYQAFRGWMKTHKRAIRLGKLTVGKLSLHRMTDMPILKCKAHDAFVVGEWLCDICTKQANQTGNEYHITRASMLWGLSTFYAVVRQAGFWMSDPELNLLRESRDTYFSCYKRLRLMAEEANRSLYGIIPKHHVVSECELQMQRTKMNAASMWTFQDEDNMGVTMKIASKTHGLFVGKNTLEKWGLAHFDCQYIL